MATPATIGALRVVLGMDSAAFEKGTKDAESRLKRFGASAAKAGAAIAAAFAAAATAVGVAVRGMINEADRMGKMAQQIGVPVEELSRLKHAADLSGVGIEGLSTAVGRLSRNMTDAANGLATPQRAFERLGISVKNTDGTFKASSAVLAEIADQFAAMPDGAEKTALAMELMGRSGATMIPMLNGGAAALNAMMREADELGIVWDAKTAAAAERFNDNLTRMRRVKDGIIMQVTSRMLPAFENLAQIMLDAAKDTNLMSAAADILTQLLRGLVTAGVIVGATFRTVGQIIGAVGRAIMAAVDGDYSTALNQLRDELRGVISDVSGTAELISRIWSEAASDIEERTRELGTRISAPIVEGAAKAKDALKDFGDGISEAQRTAERFGQSAASALHGIVTGSQSASDAIRSLINDLSRMFMNQAVQSLMGGFFGGGNPWAATVIPAFATGGSFRVGGIGGPDSQLVQFRASPGEMVDVRRPGQDGSGGRVSLDISLSVDKSGNIVPVVRKVAGDEADIRIRHNNQQVIPRMIHSHSGRSMLVTGEDV